MAALRIVQLFTHSAVMRGGAIQGLLLARHLQEGGHRVISFFHTPSSRNTYEASASLKPFGADDLDIRWINMKHPMNYLGFRLWLRQERIDIVHTHRNLAVLFAYFSTLGLASPHVVANRGTTYPLPNPLLKHIFHSTRVKHVIAVAHAVKHALVHTDNVAAHKISVVYGSFDEQRFYPGQKGSAVRAALHMPPFAPLIACIAAVDTRKGLHILLQAATEVARQFPAAKFLIVGHIEDGHYFRRLQHDVMRLGLTHHVEFTGHRADVPTILAAADVSVNASTEGEGLTGALREALAMQKPVVGTAVCGNLELIRDAESGWLVPPDNAHALAMALLDVLHHPEEAKRRAKQGYQWVLRHCTSSARLRQVERIYFALCQGHRAG